MMTKFELDKLHAITNWNVDVYEVTPRPLTNFQMVREFHKVFSRTKDPETPTIPCETTIKLRMDLIEEEIKEVKEELFTEGGCIKRDIDISKVAKELSDAMYVILGTAAVFGIDIDAVFARVHKSNMSKLDDDGKVLRREDGKVLKSKNYQPPDFTGLF